MKKQRHYFANKGPSCQGYGFSSGHVWMWELDYKESWAQKNWCFWTVVLDKTLESPLDCKEIQPIHPKGDQFWVFIGGTDVWSCNSNTLATWCEELTHLERPWCWERLKAGGAGDDRGWDGWMTLLTQWRWVWINSGSWWWTGKPGVLCFMGLQRVGHDWVTELNFDPMDCSMPGFPVHNQLLELAQSHVHQVDEAIQPSHPLLLPSPPTFNLSQHQVFSNESVLPIR